MANPSGLPATRKSTRKQRNHGALVIQSSQILRLSAALTHWICSMNQKILQYIKDNPNSTMQMISEGLSIPRGTVSYQVQMMRKLSKIRSDFVGYVCVEQKKRSRPINNPTGKNQFSNPPVVVERVQTLDPWGRAIPQTQQH